MVTIVFEKSNDDDSERREVGPVEWAQITSDLKLVVGPDGEEIAYLDGNDDWVNIQDGSVWSDMIFG
jgi:hypothetical protein